MYLEIEFEEQDQSFDLEFEQVTEISDGGYERGYAEGYEQGNTDGYTTGKTEGVTEGFADALAKRTELVVTDSGEYEPTGESTGFKKVIVGIQKGEDLDAVIAEQAELIEELSATLDEKIGAYDVGYDAALEKLTDLVVTENGEYTPSEESTGFKKVSVNVQADDRLNKMIKGELTELIPEDFKGTTEVSDYAFQKDASFYNKSLPQLQSVTFPENIVRVGNGAFSYHRTSLKKVIFQNPGKVTLGASTFFRDEVLETVDILGTIVTSTQSFQECSKLSNIDMSKVEPIGQDCFRGCISLKNITINSDTGRQSFMSCTGIETVTFLENAKTVGRSSFGGCSSIKRVVLPSNVTYVNQSAFSSCTGIEYVEFSCNLGASAFYNCTALATVKVLSNTPPSIQSNSFSGCAALEKIIVPMGCGDAYKAATNWSAYADIIVEEAM